MASTDEIKAARQEAQLTLLQAIKESTAYPEGAARLAEAYAWLTSPGQSHAGGGTTS